MQSRNYYPVLLAASVEKKWLYFAMTEKNKSVTIPFGFNFFFFFSVLIMFYYSYRAIIIRNGEVIPMSSEFTPETERQRLQYLVRDLRTISGAADDKHCPVISVVHTNAAELLWLTEGTYTH